MITINTICAFAGLLQAAGSLSLPPRADGGDGVLVPNLKSDFKKGDAPAQWAPGYPKSWGQENFHLQFNVPEPDDNFGGVVTEDEKYLAMFNGTHAAFVDLDSNATVSTFGFGAPPNVYLTGYTIRSAPQGGYHVLAGGGNSRYDYATDIYRISVGADLKPVGEVTVYPSGEIGDFDNSGRMATTGGDIYDLNDPKKKVSLKSPGRVSGMSFSGDGQYLSTVSWQDMAADLWNATTGGTKGLGLHSKMWILDEKILQYPPTNAQNWLTKFSPDNKYVIISLGTGYVQVYSLANLTAPPKVLGKFNNWIRAIEWSPDSKYLATGDTGRMQLWKFPEAELVQTWEVKASTNTGVYELYGLSWLDGGNKVSWIFRDGRYMYDFEKNQKWWWSLGFGDHSWGGWSLYYLKKKGYFVTADGDSLVRFWKS